MVVCRKDSRQEKKVHPFFQSSPFSLLLVVSCFCAACLEEEYGGWGPFCPIADLRGFSFWCMLAWKCISSSKHCNLFNICSKTLQCFEEKMHFQASMHQTEKPLKSAIGQKGPHPPNSSSKQAAQKQLTTKKGEKGDEWKKRCTFFF